MAKGVATHRGMRSAQRAGKGRERVTGLADSNPSYRHIERDYLERTILTVRIHRDADNCWPQWANIFADEIERLWAENARLREAALALYEEVEMAESVGICLPDRVPSLKLREALNR